MASEIIRLGDHIAALKAQEGYVPPEQTIQPPTDPTSTPHEDYGLNFDTDLAPANHVSLYVEGGVDRASTRLRIAKHSGSAALHGLALGVRKAHIGPIRSPFTYERAQRKLEDASYLRALSGSGNTDIKSTVQVLDRVLPARRADKKILRRQERLRELKSLNVKGASDATKARHGVAVKSSERALRDLHDKRRDKSGAAQPRHDHKHKQAPEEGKLSPSMRRNAARIRKSGNAAERRGKRIANVMARQENGRTRADDLKLARKERTQERKTEHKERRKYNRASRKIARQYAGAYAVSRAEQYKPSNLRNTAEYAQEYARSRIRREA
jgi:hypothetical protein